MSLVGGIHPIIPQAGGHIPLIFSQVGAIHSVSWSVIHPISRVGIPYRLPHCHPSSQPWGS